MDKGEESLSVSLMYAELNGKLADVIILLPFIWFIRNLNTGTSYYNDKR